MLSDFWSWLLSVAVSTGLIGAIAYFLRDALGGFFAKAIEHRFERKLEKFKSDIRNNEKEREQIRSFLASDRRERLSKIQSRRLEAAEMLLHVRDAYAQLSILVEYMKVLNTEQILNGAEDPKIAEFVDRLVKPFDIDEKLKQLGSIDKTYPRLYLSENSLKAFDVYESIILNAAMMMKFFAINLPKKGHFIKTSNLSKTIIELVPSSKEGFEKFGERYAYYWATYFYDEILRALRREISGTDAEAQGVESAVHLVMDSQRAQEKIDSVRKKIDLPDTLIKPDENAIQSCYAIAENAARQQR